MRIRTGSVEPELGVSERTVEVGGRAFATPRRALSLTASGPSEALEAMDPRCLGLVEVYRELTRDSLLEIDSNAQLQLDFVNQLFRRVNALPDGGEQVVMLALALRDKAYCPRGVEAEYLADLAGAPFVQFTMLPRVIP